MIYFIADTHFNEKNILFWSKRPFCNIEEMNQTIITRWNNTVSTRDTVYHLGDVGINFGNILSQLNGNKILIKGNHDFENCLNENFKLYFSEIIDYPIIFKNFWILSHEPVYLNKYMPYVNIFGHVHDNPIYKDYSPQSYCVSADRIDYTPISFDKIKEKINSFME